MTIYNTVIILKSRNQTLFITKQICITLSHTIPSDSVFAVTLGFDFHDYNNLIKVPGSNYML